MEQVPPRPPCCKRKLNGKEQPIADSCEPPAVDGCFTKPFKYILPLT